MRRFPLLILCILLVAPVIAMAQDFTALGPEQLAKLIFGAVQTGNWKLVAALAVVALVWLARRVGGNYIPLLKTDRGGALLVLLLGVAGALATAFTAGATLTAQVLFHGITTGIMAAGGFNLMKKLLWPTVPAPTVLIAPAAAAGAEAAKNPGSTLNQ